MKRNYFKALALLGIVLLSGCIEDVVVVLTEPELQWQKATPGQALDLGVTYSIDNSGIFFLPDGASTIRTTCFGKTTLLLDRGGDLEINTCDSDSGGSNHTNIVSDLNRVEYDLDHGARVLVLVD